MKELDWTRVEGRSALTEQIWTTISLGIRAPLQDLIGARVSSRVWIQAERSVWPPEDNPWIILVLASIHYPFLHGGHYPY